MRQPELTTNRLLLRNFKLDDAPEIESLAGNYNVSKTTLNIPFPYLPGMAEEWINTLAKIRETILEQANILKESEQAAS